MAPSQQALPSTLRSLASSGQGAGEGRGSVAGWLQLCTRRRGAARRPRQRREAAPGSHGLSERHLPPELEIECPITAIHRCRAGRKGLSGASGRREASPGAQQAPIPKSSAAGTNHLSTQVHANWPQPQRLAASLDTAGPKQAVQEAQALLAALNDTLDFYTSQGQGRIMAGLLHYTAALREQLERSGAMPALPATPPPDLAQRSAAQRNMRDFRLLASHLERLLAGLPAALDAQHAQHEADKESLLRQTRRAESRAGQAERMLKRQQRAEASLQESLERARKRVRTMEGSLEEKRAKLRRMERQAEDRARATRAKQARLHAALDEAPAENRRLRRSQEPNPGRTQYRR